MSRSISLLAFALALVGCTFNVDTFARETPVSNAPASAATTLRADFSSLAHLSGFGVRVDGDATAAAPSATVTMGGLLSSGTDQSAVIQGVHVGWPVLATDTLGLTIGYDGPALETVWTEGVNVTVPAAWGLDFTLDATSLEVDGVAGPIHAVADSGSIHIRHAGDFTLSASSGSIDVQGRGGSASCDSGSIAVTATAAVVLMTDSGSIEGQFGGGGSASADSGSIRLQLVGPLDRDLTLSAGSGSIRLIVPVGTSMRVQTQTGSGSSHVDVGGVHSDDDFDGTIGSGGFLVHATTGSGSIDIVEE